MITKKASNQIPEITELKKGNGTKYDSKQELKTSMETVEKILEEDPKTRDPDYSWLFLTKVLREMGFNIFIKYDSRMPSPETLFRERREILNKKNKYPQSFIPEEGVTYERSNLNPPMSKM